MSIAAYSRGSRLVTREANERMPVATPRADAPGFPTCEPKNIQTARALLARIDGDEK